MNENLNLIEILKDCPKGTKLYSPIYGDVEFVCVLQNEGIEYPIQIKMSDDVLDGFTKDGRMFAEYKGECTLFPSREERDWSKFKVIKSINPKNTVHFYVARDKDGELWLYIGKPIRELYVFNNGKHSITLVSSKDFSQYGLNERDYDYLKWENEPVEVFLNMED